jgi:hypothetical protein
MRDVIAVLDGINPSGSAGANYSGGSSWYAGAPTMPSSEGLAGYLEAFRTPGFVVNPSGSAGANYSGGSSWYAGAPTMPSSEGLASLEPQGYEITRVPSASGGANYSGGSSWAPGFPLYPSSQGLASIRIRGALHGLISGGVGEVAAAVAAKRALHSGALTATGCQAAYQAAFVAARLAGYDVYFARAAGDRAASRCLAEGWALYDTKS